MVSVSSAQKLTITAKENTWIGIRVDQQEGQQAYLRPGDTVTFTGAQFRLDVGNAGGIDLTLQGNPLPPLGKSGQIVHITLP
jgi:cytoskeleton protein RodZ